MKKLNKELLSQKLDKRAESDIKEENISCASLCVWQDGTELVKKHYSSKYQEIDDNSVFRLASMTKPITAVAVMIAAERGLLSLDDSIGKYLPKYKTMTVGEVNDDGTISPKEEVTVTIRHLLTHSSGIEADKTGEIHAKNVTDKIRKTLEGYIDYYSDKELEFKPGTRYWYSATVAFDILAKIVSDVTNCDFNEFIKENIFTPCNMTDTTFLPSKEQWARIVTKYDKSESHVAKTYENCVFESFPCTHYLGGAGLISTLKDYTNFGNMLLNEGSFNGNKILSPESVKLMRTVQFDIPGDWADEWGLGMRVIVNDKYLEKGAFGWSGAYGTHFFVDPENKIMAIYLKNSVYDGGSGAQTARNFEEDIYTSFE